MMNVLTTCPCCSSLMLHHVSNHRDYWFCRHCWSEMPNISEIKTTLPSKRQPQLVNLSVGLEGLKKAVLV